MLPIITASPPSLSCEALPAVTVPSERKAGFNFDSPSSELSARTPSSRLMVLAFGPLPTVTGTTSSAKAPASQAAAAR